MESTEVIIRPVISEKATFQSDEHNRYLFEVNRRATKNDIRRAIEELYEVHVIGVNTLRRRGHQRRNRFGFWQTPSSKRAVVKIEEGQRIDLF